MKYKGKKLEGRNTDFIVFNKDGIKVQIKAEAVPDFKEFNKLCPLPEPPVKFRPGGKKEVNIKDPEYLKAIDDYALKKTNYTICKSLMINEDIEWEYIDIQNPETYSKWETEFTESGFTEVETTRILGLCIQVNNLDDGLMDQAKEDFLAEALQQDE